MLYELQGLARPSRDGGTPCFVAERFLLAASLCMFKKARLALMDYWCNSSDECCAVYRLITQMQLPNSKRSVNANSQRPHLGKCLGISWGGNMKPFLSSRGPADDDVARAITKWAHATHPSFKFSAIQINFSCNFHPISI